MGTFMEHSQARSPAVPEAWPPERIRELWNTARKLPLGSHPYLEENGIRQPGVRVRVINGSLAIPMYSLTQGLVNLCLIDAGGNIEYLSDAEVKSTYSVFGGKPALERTNTIYVCEGWTNGWTIHNATGACVLVVFDRSGLMPLTEAVRRRFPKSHMIVCAANERWNYGERNGLRQPNPGVRAAHRVATRVEADLAVPDFQNLEGKPVSFNDLRLREGKQAVIRRIAPNQWAAWRIQLEGHDVLEVVCFGRFPDSSMSVPPTLVGDRLRRVIGGRTGSTEHESAEVAKEVRLLGSIGLKVVGDCMLLSNRGGGWLHERLDTRWPDRTWLSLLRELPEVRPTAPKYFSPSLTSRATSVPLCLLTVLKSIVFRER